MSSLAQRHKKQQVSHPVTEALQPDGIIISPKTEAPSTLSLDSSSASPATGTALTPSTGALLRVTPKSQAPLPSVPLPSLSSEAKNSAVLPPAADATRSKPGIGGTTQKPVRKRKVLKMLVQKYRQGGAVGVAHEPCHPHLLEIAVDCGMDGVESDVISEITKHIIARPKGEYPLLGSFNHKQYRIRFLKKENRLTTVPAAIWGGSEDIQLQAVRIDVAKTPVLHYVIPPAVTMPPPGGMIPPSGGVISPLAVAILPPGAAIPPLIVAIPTSTSAPNISSTVVSKDKFISAQLKQIVSHPTQKKIVLASASSSNASDLVRQVGLTVRSKTLVPVSNFNSRSFTIGESCWNSVKQADSASSESASSCKNEASDKGLGNTGCIDLTGDPMVLETPQSSASVNLPIRWRSTNPFVVSPSTSPIDLDNQTPENNKRLADKHLPVVDELRAAKLGIKLQPEGRCASEVGVSGASGDSEGNESSSVLDGCRYQTGVGGDSILIGFPFDAEEANCERNVDVVEIAGNAAEMKSENVALDGVIDVEATTKENTACPRTMIATTRLDAKEVQSTGIRDGEVIETNLELKRCEDGAKIGDAYEVRKIISKPMQELILPSIKGPYAMVKKVTSTGSIASALGASAVAPAPGASAVAQSTKIIVFRKDGKCIQLTAASSSTVSTVSGQSLTSVLKNIVGQKERTIVLIPAKNGAGSGLGGAPNTRVIIPIGSSGPRSTGAPYLATVRGAAPGTLVSLGSTTQGNAVVVMGAANQSPGQRILTSATNQLSRQPILSSATNQSLGQRVLTSAPLSFAVTAPAMREVIVNSVTRFSFNPTTSSAGSAPSVNTPRSTPSVSMSRPAASINMSRPVCVVNPGLHQLSSPIVRQDVLSHIGPVVIAGVAAAPTSAKIVRHHIIVKSPPRPTPLHSSSKVISVVKPSPHFIKVKDPVSSASAVIPSAPSSQLPGGGTSSSLSASGQLSSPDLIISSTPVQSSSPPANAAVSKKLKPSVPKDCIEVQDSDDDVSLSYFFSLYHHSTTTYVLLD